MAFAPRPNAPTRARLPIVGPIAGPTHIPQGFLLAGGRSLHPLERMGAVSGTQMPSMPVAPLPRPGDAPHAAMTGFDLIYPHLLTPGVTNNPAGRV